MNWLRRSASRPPRRRLLLEALEDRTAPAIVTWSGAGANALWSNGANWQGGVAPVAGDDLVFPAGAQQLTNSHNLGHNFNSLTFGDAAYTINGQPLRVLGNITANNQPARLVNINVQLTLTQTSFDQTVQVSNAGANLRFSQPISSSGAGLIKTGAGFLQLAGDNSGFSGAMTVQVGAVSALAPNAFGSAAQGTIVANGAAVWLQSILVNEPLTLQGTGIQGSGALRAIPGATIATVWSGPISMQGNTRIGVDTGAFLTITGTISHAGGANFGITKVRQGTLILNPTTNSTYLGLTQVSEGVLQVNKDGALGGAGGAGTVVSAGSSLRVLTNTNPTINGEPLTLNGGGTGALSTIGSFGNLNSRAVWNAAVTLGSNVSIEADVGSTLAFTQIGQASAGLGVTINNGAGTVEYVGAAANTYTGTTSVDSGRLLLNKSAVGVAGPLVIGGAGVNAEVRLNASNLIQATVPVTVNPLGLLNLTNRVNTFNNLTLNGAALQVTAGGGINLGTLTATSTSAGAASISGGGTVFLSAGAHTLTVNDGPAAQDLVIANQFTGTGSITKTGPGRLHVSSTSLNLASVVQGDLQISPAAASLGTVTLSGGSLSGSGQLGPLTAGGVINPGINAGAIAFGGLQAQNVVLDNQATLFVDLSNGSGGPPLPGTHHDFLNANGNVSLNGALLAGSSGTGINLGDVFPIVQTTGTVSGSFMQLINGVPTPLGPGATAVIGGMLYRVDYASNRVSLTAIPRGDTGVTLTTSASPAVLGQPVTYTATVASVHAGAGTPSGTVVFSIDGVGQATVNVVAGQATFTTLLSAGLRRIGAAYSGDTFFNPAVSSELLQTVTSSANGIIATAVAVGSVGRAPLGANDAIVVSTEVDFYSFAVSAGQLVRFEIRGNTGVGFDSFLRLFDSSGTLLSFNDDGPARGRVFSRDASFTHRFARGGNYFVAVSGYPNYRYNAVTGAAVTDGTTGAYGLTIFVEPPEPDDNDQIREATPVGPLTEVRQVRDFIITSPTDVDMFRFTASAGQRLTIVAARAGRGSFTPVLRLFNAQGRSLSLSRPGNGQAVISFTFAEAGAYYLGVSGRGNIGYNALNGRSDRAGTTGAYVLTFTPGSGDRLSRARRDAIRRPVATTPRFTGLVYFDQTGDGQRQAGERGLGSHVVLIDRNNNGVRDDGEQAVATSSQGTYLMSVSGRGRLFVFAVPVTQFGIPVEKVTAPPRGFHVLNLGGRRAHLVFGMTRYLA